MLSISDLDHGLRFDFEHYADELFGRLIEAQPAAVWEEMAVHLSGPQVLRSWRIERHLDPDRDDRAGAGILFKLPEHLYLDWVRGDPEKRAPVVVTWLPLVCKGSDGQRSWHPALEHFVADYCEIDGVLSGIGARLHPTSWWGSIIPFLEPWLPLLQAWQNHPHESVRRWAQVVHEGLVRQIAAERQDDAEREGGIW